ncbi:MAG: TetR family transcriptional regulator [Pseudomonadota bacterium]|nr:TetR family transcriptional regulator [Pseudomonadota bacterium]
MEHPTDSAAAGGGQAASPPGDATPARPPQAASRGPSLRSVPEAPRDRILFAAERHFAEQGSASPDLDAIAARAGVDRAEIGWHFAGPEDLTHEVLRAVARRSVRIQLDALSRLEGGLRAAPAPGRPPASLRAVIEAFCSPFFNGDTGPMLALLLIGRQRQPTPWSLALVRDEFDDLDRLYIAALGRAAPWLSPQTLRWRFNFMVANVLLSTVEPGLPRRVARLAERPEPVPAPGRMREELVDFLVAAFGPSI